MLRDDVLRAMLLRHRNLQRLLGCYCSPAGDVYATSEAAQALTLATFRAQFKAALDSNLPDASRIAICFRPDILDALPHLSFFFVDTAYFARSQPVGQ